MSKFISSSKSVPCPICRDKKGKCKISEYKYLCFCGGKPNAKVGDLVGTWQCKRKEEEQVGFFLWEDQRVVLQSQARASCREIFLTVPTNGRLRFKGKAVPIEDSRFCIYSSIRGEIASDLTYEQAQLMLAELKLAKGGAK
jgi:hypothetical protein